MSEIRDDILEKGRDISEIVYRAGALTDGQRSELLTILRNPALPDLKELQSAIASRDATIRELRDKWPLCAEHKDVDIGFRCVKCAVDELREEIASYAEDLKEATDAGLDVVKDNNRLQEENAHLIDELAMANSMVGDLKGCCDHGCLIQPPTVGTNGGKCYCTQGKVRGYIGRLREEISRLEDQVKGALAYTEIMAKGRKEIEQTAKARIAKLDKGLREIKAKQEIVKSNSEAPQSFMYHEKTAWTNGYTCAAREIAEIAAKGLKESE